ncbi:MAG TPA: hypothetical protein VGO61_20930 [Steroidobacteraceae bacterium]|nr:hypothetical protein [Steroidobacteraceae bacterium]
MTRTSDSPRKGQRRLIPVAVLIAFLVPAPGAAAEMPGEYREAVDRAAMLGTAIFVHDAAAARATDELFRRRVIKKDKRLRGWITDIAQNPSGVIVTFVGEEGGSAQALYRVRVPAGEAPLVYEALKPAQPLSDSERARFAARTLAIGQFTKRPERCAKSYNTVVLPMARPGDPFILVYLLAATDEPGVVIAGGHVRYEVSPDGAHIEGERTFTKTCFEMPHDKDAVALTMTHLLDPTPTEIQVFLSRLHDVPLYVSTVQSGMMWLVDGSRIEFIQRFEEKH